MLFCILKSWRGIISAKGSRKEREIKQIMAGNYRTSKLKISGFFKWKKYSSKRRSTKTVIGQLRKTLKSYVQDWRTYKETEKTQEFSVKEHYEKYQMRNTLREWADWAISQKIARRFRTQKLFRSWRDLFVYKEKTLPQKWRNYTLRSKVLSILHEAKTCRGNKRKADEFREYYTAKKGIQSAHEALRSLYENMLLTRKNTELLQRNQAFYQLKRKRAVFSSWKNYSLAKIRDKDNEELSEEYRMKRTQRRILLLFKQRIQLDRCYSLSLFFIALRTHSKLQKNKRTMAKLGSFIHLKRLWAAFGLWKVNKPGLISIKARLYEIFDNLGASEPQESKPNWMEELLQREQAKRKELESKIDNIKFNLLSC